MRKVIGAALAAVCVMAMPAAAQAACPGVNGNWAGTGPFAVTTQASGQGHTVYRPAQLGTLGCTTHPVIIWGNGTGTAPSMYDGLLRHWASHGFIVAAADTRNAYSGQEMVAGLDYLEAQNANAASVFAGKVDTAHVAAAGHSQGGGGAINAAGDPRVTASLPLQPSPYAEVENLHSPVFFLAGQYDFIVAPQVVKGLYDQAGHVVAIYGNLAGANHATPSGNGGGYRGPATAWLRYQLMGDQTARSLFFGPGCGYCSSPVWTEFTRNANALAV
jgi:dienelactone hydrolase